MPLDGDARLAGREAVAGSRRGGVARTSFGPRQARDLYRRLARWRPAYWPLVLSYLLVLVSTGWFAEPSAGALAWPLTVVWTWPLFGTLIGIVGIRRTSAPADGSA